MTTTDVALIEEPHELQLIATSKEQMAESQQRLVGWAQRKIDDAKAQMSEASEAKTVALAGGFNTLPFTRAYKRGERLFQFYEKIKAALEAGYVIIPDFPVDVFAVRTKRHAPVELPSQYQNANRDQQSEGPPRGEGEYRDSQPLVFDRSALDSKGMTATNVTHFYAAEFQDLIDFPMSIAKPEIMDEVRVAMQHKVFDEIGVLPKREQKKKDPIVVGIIRDPRSTTYSTRRVMFLLAWYLDTRTL